MHDAGAPITAPRGRRGAHLLHQIAALALGALACVVLLQVVARFVLRMSFEWTLDLATVLLVWTTFLGAAVASWFDDHFAVTFIVDVLPRPLRAVAELIANLAVTVTLATLLVYGFRYSLVQMSQTYPSLAIPKGWAALAIPVCALLMLPRYISDTLKALRCIVRGADTAQPRTETAVAERGSE
jgi:TRAP-type C4-dicarboxylate transport system permease small subunit